MYVCNIVERLCRKSAFDVAVMGVDQWVDRGTAPHFVKWRGRPLFCPPTFSGVDIFVLKHIAPR